MIGKRIKKITFILLVIWIVLLAFATILNRTTSYEYLNLIEPLWSYKAMLKPENAYLKTEILGNILMFTPIGFLSSTLFEKKKILKAVLFGLSLSLCIEVCQLFFNKGSFEVDDLLNNTLGAFLGGIGYLGLAKILKEKIVIAVIICGIAAVTVGIIYCIRMPKPVDESPSHFVFQLDSIEEYGDTIQLSGFCFPYGKDTPSAYKIILKSTSTGKKIKLNTQTGIEREGVDNYFKCDYNYSKSGFCASVESEKIKPDKEYEVLADIEGLSIQCTGTFIKGNKIYYAPEKEFIAPNVNGTDLEEIVNSGYLRVYRPNYHCWVYQYSGCIYWIAEKGFAFEPNGQTYIQYHLNTTQIEKLPQWRLENNWFSDNIGGNFEDYEITSEINCGEYRVCKRELPTEYSITSIVTGYHKDGSWIWQNFFRPIYEFE